MLLLRRRLSRKSFCISNLASGEEHHFALGVTCCETPSLHFTVSTALKACLKPGIDFPRGRLMSKGCCHSLMIHALSFIRAGFMKRFPILCCPRMKFRFLGAAVYRGLHSAFERIE